MRCSAAIYLLWYAALDHHNTSQPDGWAAALIAAAAAVLVTDLRGPTPAAAALAGVLIGLCVLTKPTYGTFLLMPFAQAAMYRQEHGSRWVLGRWVAASVAFLIPIAACAIWFAFRGALPYLLDVQFGWIPTRYADVESAWMNRMQQALLSLTTGKFAIPMALAVGGLAVTWRTRRPDTILLAVWLFAAVVSVLAQGKFWTYHWQPLYPPLAIVAGVGMRGMFSLRPAPGPRFPIFPLAIGGVLFVGALIQPLTHVYRWSAFTLGLLPGADYDRIEWPPYGRHGGIVGEVTNHLKARTTKHDHVLVWGTLAGVNYLSGRRSISRFGVAQPLVDGADDDFRRRFRTEFLVRLYAEPPIYIVALNEAVCARARTVEERRLIGQTEALFDCAASLPPLRDLITRRYALERTIGSVDILRRRF